MPKYEYNEEQKVDLPGGGSITVTVSSPDPIDREAFLMLKSPAAAMEMGRCLADLGNAMRPLGSAEITL